MREEQLGLRLGVMTRPPKVASKMPKTFNLFLNNLYESSSFNTMLVTT